MLLLVFRADRPPRVLDWLPTTGESWGSRPSLPQSCPQWSDPCPGSLRVRRGSERGGRLDRAWSTRRAKRKEAVGREARREHHVVDVRVFDPRGRATMI